MMSLLDTQKIRKNGGLLLFVAVVVVRKSNSLPYYLVRSFARCRMSTLAIDIYLPTLKNVVHLNPIIYI